jgi:hypothetical protein
VRVDSLSAALAAATDAAARQLQQHEATVRSMEARHSEHLKTLTTTIAELHSKLHDANAALDAAVLEVGPLRQSASVLVVSVLAVVAAAGVSDA